jgi:oligopeptide/dipeptide ABC transporter ATP-binding protein
MSNQLHINVVESDRALLELHDIAKHFPVRGRNSAMLRAVDGVSLEVSRGEIVGLVGESGSGKSTLARVAVRLHDATSGSVVFDGRDITQVRGRELRRYRTGFQMVFQDPFSSFDPTSPMLDTILEPLDVHSKLKRSARVKRAQELFRSVGLGADLVHRFPREMSGGQLQRAAIARALSTSPKLLVLDEPVSALDVSTQAQIVNLLEDLRAELGLAMLLVAHDLAVVRHISDRLAVMYLGQIVEEGPVEDVYEHPKHPYTAALLSAIPSVDPVGAGRRERIVLRGEIPSPIAPPSGCRFRTRCPWAMPICSEVEPVRYPTAAGSTVACHLHTTGPELQGASVAGLSPLIAVR